MKLAKFKGVVALLSNEDGAFVLYISFHILQRRFLRFAYQGKLSGSIFRYTLLVGEPWPLLKCRDHLSQAR